MNQWIVGNQDLIIFEITSLSVPIIAWGKTHTSLHYWHPFKSSLSELLELHLVFFFFFPGDGGAVTAGSRS